VKLVYQGLGIPAIGPLPPNVWGARSDVVTYPYDPPRARKLLAEAGWQGEREAPLKLFAPSVASQYMPAPRASRRSSSAAWARSASPSTSS
jgi:ABC-type transport system substrate-binding protein